MTLIPVGTADGHDPREPELHLQQNVALGQVEPKTDPHHDRLLPPLLEELNPGVKAIKLFSHPS
jgi:hypothetical protein